jgi:hypothetical protein
MQSGRDTFVVDGDAGAGDACHVGQVLVQRHRRGPDVRTRVQQLTRAVASRVCQSVAIRRCSGAAGAADFDQSFHPRMLNDAFEQRVRDMNAFGHLGPAGLSGVERLQDEFTDGVGREPDVIETRRTPRHDRLSH